MNNQEIWFGLQIAGFLSPFSSPLQREVKKNLLSEEIPQKFHSPSCIGFDLHVRIS